MKHPFSATDIPSAIETLNNMIQELKDIKEGLMLSGEVPSVAISITIEKDEGIQTYGLCEANKKVAVLHYMDQLDSLPKERRLELLEILTIREVTGIEPEFATLDPNGKCTCPKCQEKPENPADVIPFPNGTTIQ